MAFPAVLLRLLSAGDVTRPDEAKAIAAGTHTRQILSANDGSHWSLDNLAPYLNDEPQLDKPPGLVWLQLASYRIASWFDADLPIDRAVTCSRVVAACLAILTITSVFWAGRSIGGTRTAFLSTLLCTASPFLLYYSAIASPTIAHACSASLGIAAALWAIRPYQSPPSVWRQAIGWTGCGLVLAAGILTVGTPILLSMIVPMILFVLLCPNRTSHLLGLLTALLLGLVLVLPWALYVHERRPDAWQLWFNCFPPPNAQYLLGDFIKQIGNRFVHTTIILAPWTIWAYAGLLVLHRVTVPATAARKSNILVSVWFFAVCLILMIQTPKSDHTDALAPLIPAASVLVGLLLANYHELAAQGCPPHSCTRLAWFHAALMLLTSLAIPFWLLYQPRLIPDINPSLYWTFVSGFSIVLVGVSLLTAWWVQHDLPIKPTCCWIIWTLLILVTLSVLFPYTPYHKNPIKEQARTVSDLVGNQPLLWLSTGPQAPSQPNPFLLLYLRSSIPVINPDQLQQAKQSNSPIYVIAPHDLPTHLLPNTVVRASIPALNLVLIEIKSPTSDALVN